MTTTVATLAALVGGRVMGDADRPIVGVADLRAADAEHIGFVRSPKYINAAKESAAGALISCVELDCAATVIVVKDVQLAYAKVALYFHPVRRAQETSIHPTAVVDPAAELADPVEIGPHAVVGRARIGAGSILGAGVSVADDCVLGNDCVLMPRVVLYHGVRLGDRVVVHAGTVIGADGFGYAMEGAQFVKVPQIGAVQIGDDVEIGANCTIDRGAMRDTVVGARSKIDNLCHLAHNVVTGEDCAIAGACFIAGSTVLGNRVHLAGHVVMAGHLQLVDDVRIGGNSCLIHSVEKPGDYMGFPVVEKRQWPRVLVAQRELPSLRAEVQGLRRSVEGLQKPEQA